MQNIPFGLSNPQKRYINGWFSLNDPVEVCLAFSREWLECWHRRKVKSLCTYAVEVLLPFAGQTTVWRIRQSLVAGKDSGNTQHISWTSVWHTVDVFSPIWFAYPSYFAWSTYAHSLPQSPRIEEQAGKHPLQNKSCLSIILINLHLYKILYKSRSVASKSNL